MTRPVHINMKKKICARLTFLSCSPVTLNAKITRSDGYTCYEVQDECVADEPSEQSEGATYKTAARDIVDLIRKHGCRSGDVAIKGCAAPESLIAEIEKLLNDPGTCWCFLCLKVKPEAVFAENGECSTCRSKALIGVHLISYDPETDKLLVLARPYKARPFSREMSAGEGPYFRQDLAILANRCGADYERACHRPAGEASAIIYAISTERRVEGKPGWVLRIDPVTGMEEYEWH